MSSDERELRLRSAVIDKKIEDDSKKLKKECKILLLGAGESGKSTIVKQMKIIHQNGYTRQELESFKPTIVKNTIDSFYTLLFYVKRMGLQFCDPSVENLAEYLRNNKPENDHTFHMTEDMAEKIDIIWNDEQIPTIMDMCMDNPQQYYLMDSAPYFFSNVRRIGAQDYVPNEQDVLRARTKTTGISETRFNMGQLSIHMFDVGGQRSERRKWIHCFEAVTSIIFCVALSEYDQILLEEASQNRMAESLTLFESVINSRWFIRTSIILFLNKIDLFRIKLQKVPLERYFPEYMGGPDLNKAAKFILWRFTQTNRAKLNIYPHLTQATDTSNILLVFAAVKVTILQNALKDSGIM
jgi:guanine nucleotide-binding protein subunit alpha